MTTATVLSAVLLWLTVIVGTYVIFPPYRVTPPAGVTEGPPSLAQDPASYGGQPSHGA